MRSIQEAEFLEQILAAPDDDEPRLIYADWLEDRGDPRGEFIRIQCELAVMGEIAQQGELTDPQLDRLDWLVEREGELRMEHEAQWTAPLRKFVHAVQFKRGMIEYAESNVDNIIQHADAIFEAAPVRLMTVTGASGKLDKFVKIKGVELLNGLALDNSFLYASDIDALITLLEKKQLAGLSLSHCGLDDDELENLSTLQSCGLKQLDLSHNLLRNRTAVWIAECSGFEQLEVLNLGANKIRFNGAKALAKSVALKSLKQVIVQGNVLEQRSIDALRERFPHVIV